MRRDPAAQKFLAQNPAAQAAFALAAKGDGIAVRAATDGSPTEILLYDEIGFWGITAKDFLAALNDAGQGPIVLRINSPGGDVFDGLSIYNAIKQRGNVTAVVDGIAASIASIIAMGASDIAMQEASMMMIHKAWCFTIGNEDDHLSAAITLGKIDGQLAAIYAGRADGDEGAMLDLMKAETWLTSTEAEAQGFADRVLKAETTKPEKKQALSADSIAALQRRLRLAQAA